MTEIKAGETVNPDFWKTLLYFEKLNKKPLRKTVYYGGAEVQTRTGNLHLYGWKNISR